MDGILKIEYIKYNRKIDNCKLLLYLKVVPNVIIIFNSLISYPLTFIQDEIR
jgi:hypothetical protein